MKREIKFRGKRLDNGKWAYGDLVHKNYGSMRILSNLNTWADNDTDVEPYGEEFYIDPDSVGQYTGRKDKNGKAIYEDDIILQQDYNSHRVPMLVRFEDGAFVVGRHWSSCTPSRPMLIQKRSEVIGNIHDNPELLGGGEL